jgi:acyl-CoA thioesterase-2
MVAGRSGLRKVNDGLCSRIESAYTPSYTALSPLSHTCKRTKMSRTAPSAMQQLVSSLDLEPLEQDLFRGTSPQVGWQRVFGGQVIGQALVAAQRTVKSTRPCAFAALPISCGRAIHAVPIIYDGRPDSRRLELCHKAGCRDPARSRRSFPSRPRSRMTKKGLEYQAPMPAEVTPPRSLLGKEELRAAFLIMFPSHIRSYWERERPIEVKPVGAQSLYLTRKADARQKVWVRTTGPVPDDRIIQAAILAYLSDMTLLDTALLPMESRSSIAICRWRASITRCGSTVPPSSTTGCSTAWIRPTPMAPGDLPVAAFISVMGG